MSRELEYRAGAELRVDDTKKLVSYAVVVDVRSRDLGGFVEVVKPQACDALGDVVCLFNHDSSQVIGRTPATLSLRRDNRGVALPPRPATPTAGRDASELVRRGDIRGPSFGLKTRKARWSNQAGATVREL